MSQTLLMARMEDTSGFEVRAFESEPVIVAVEPGVVTFCLDDGRRIAFDPVELRSAVASSCSPVEGGER